MVVSKQCMGGLGVVVALVGIGESAWADSPNCTANPPVPPVVINGKDYNQFFTQSGNLVPASGNWAGGLGSVSASEASTSQVLELISQRRLQASQACTVGFVRINGVCQPRREATPTKSGTKKVAEAGA